MNHNRTSWIAPLSLALALLFSVLVIAPAHALGPFGHNTVARDAYDLLPEAELKALLTEYQGLVLAGSVYPDWCIKGSYENYPGDPDEAAHSAQFIATYLEYIRLHFTVPYDTEQERKTIAFLFGLIVHNVSDPAFHSDYLPHAFDIDNCAPPDLLEQYGVGPHQLVELAVDSFSMALRSPLGYNEVDWWFLPYEPMTAAYHELGVDIEWSDLQAGWAEYRALSTAQVDGEFLGMPVFLVALLNNAASFYTYRPGGMTDGAEQVETAWLAAWDLINDPDYSGVNHVRPDGSNTADCQSWESACTLQRALSHYVPGMEVWVAEGTYKPSAIGNRAATFKVGLGRKVYGGFPDTGNPIFADRDPGSYPTILSGDLLGNDNATVQYDEPTRADNSLHVVTVTEGALLDGFIIEGGNANGDPINSLGAGNNNGGGVYNRTSVTLSNATLRNNSAKDKGGGMYSYQFNKHLVTNVAFENNSARYGGGLNDYLTSGSGSRLINVTFSGNSAAQYGGGIYSSMYAAGAAPTDHMYPVLTHVTFSGNSAASGGGVYNGNNSALVLINTIIANSSSGGDCESSGGALGESSINNLIDQAGSACGLVNGSYGNIVGGDPLLGSFGNYGGATPTFPLQPGSPAIDAADLAMCTGPNSKDDVFGANGLDQRGATRPKGSGCDIGAYEYTEPLRVKPDGAGVGDGQSWETAISLQHALSIALVGDEMWLASGVYTPTASPVDRSATFQLKKGVALYGGFAGTETTRSQRAPSTNLTVLSGDIDANDINTDGNNIAETTDDIQGSNSYHVVSGATGAALDGFIITAGQADGTYPNDEGGGLYNYHADNLNLTNLAFRGNWAINGGGMFNSYSDPTVTDVTFDGNAAPGGGGMYNWHSSPAVTGVTFNDNSASDSGGGMYNLDSSPSLANVTFSGNSAYYFGGGVYNIRSSPTIAEVIFSGNTAGYGAGMGNYSSDPTIRNVTFSGNTASRYSGGLYNDQSNPTLTNVTFSGNSAAYYGGAMLNGTSSPTLTNVTFSGNSVDAGSVYNKGGAIFNYADSDPQIRNTIFWGNTAPTGAQIYNSVDSAPLVVYSIVQGGYGGEGNLMTDPKLGTLGENGGFTPTIPLLAGSSAVNNGNPAYCTGGSDQRGVSYVGPCDIGAYEYDGPAPTLYAKPAASGSNDCSSWANACTLQSALGSATSGNQIWVAAGLHKPTTSTTDRAATFQLKSGVAVYGGFDGSETALSQRDPSEHVTILSGDIDSNDSQTPIILGIESEVYNDANSHHVVTGASGAILDGFTITAGSANVGTTCPGTACGGGMYNDGSSPAVTRVIFRGNLAVFGGGMYNNSGSPTLTDVTFVSNRAMTDGGGLYNNSSNPNLTDVTFSVNLALDGHGGGMRNQQSSPVVSDVAFNGNSARWGGGMHNYQGSPVFTNVTFSDNSGTDNGGGMGNEQSSPTITNATFSGNWSNAGAGMHNFDSSNPVLTNVTFSSNSAAISGGGMENMTSSSPTVMGATFWGNSATWGGGMNNYGNSNSVLANVTFYQNTASDNGGGMNNDASNPRLTNVTIVGNTGENGAGGIFNFASSSPMIRNTILWGNAPQQIVTSSGSPSVTYSVVQGGYAGAGNTSNDPNLGSFDFNGGFTKTIPLGAVSSAIDTGYDTYCAAAIGAPNYGAGWHDQRGIVRPEGTHCDIGAYEYQYEYTLTITSPHGAVTKDPDQTTYHEGDVVRLSAAPEAGWSFTSWSGGLTGSSNPAFVTIQGNTSVTADYTQNEYTLTVTSAHGTVTKNPEQATYHYGDVVELTATPSTGWSFDYWSGGLTGSLNPASVTISGNTSVTANYAEIEYSLTVTSAHGTVTKMPSWTTYHYGEVVQLNVLPDPGWSLSEWSGDLTGSSNPAFVTIQGDTSITASYVLNEYTLTITSAHGTVTTSPDQPTYHYGDVVQLSAAPDAGWAFLDWSGGLTGTANPDSVTIQGNTAITANYNGPPTRITLSDDTVAGNLPIGTEVGNLVSTDEVAPAAPFTYSLATGDECTDNASFTIEGDRLLTAQVFDSVVKDSYAICIRSTDAGGLSGEEPFTITISPNNYIPILFAPADSSMLMNNRPTFTWMRMNQVSSYTIQIGRDPAFVAVLGTYTATSSSFTPPVDLPPTIDPGVTTLSWRVRVNKVGVPANAWSAPYSFITAHKTPSIPLLVKPVSNLLVHPPYTPPLDWSDSTVPAGASAFDRYQVQIDDSAGFLHPELDSAGLALHLTLSRLLATEYAYALAPNTRYYWRVRAFNVVGEYSTWSAVRYFRTAIPPPTLSAPLAGDHPLHRRPTFDWDDVPGATGYVLQISKNSTFTLLVGSYGVTASTYTPAADLPANTLLFWRVLSRGLNGPSTWSALPYPSFTTPTPPSTPALLTPAHNALTTDYTPRLDWTASTVPLGTAFDHYELWVDDDPAFGSPYQASIAGLAGHEFTFPDVDALNPNTTYSWKVRSFNDAVPGQQHSTWSAVRTIRTAVLPPTMSAPLDGDHPLHRRPTFDWSDVPGATGYVLQISKNSTFTLLVGSYGVTASTYTPAADLPANTLLFWRVLSRGLNGPSAWSAVPYPSFTTPTPPSTPALLTPAHNALTTDYTPRLDWTASTVPLGTAFDHYELWVDDDPAFGSPYQASIAGLAGHEFTFPDADALNPNTTYSWKVRSFNDAVPEQQHSTWSAVRVIRTAILPPTLLTPADSSSTTNRKPTFTWGNETGATGYTIQISKNAGFTLLVGTYKVTVSAYTPTVDLPTGMTLSWRVRATGPNGPSGFSDVRSLLVQ